MGKYSKKALEWWIEDPSFDQTAWWMSPDGRAVNEDDENLLLEERANQSRVYRPGPVYWELLRRHPELPRLRRVARGKVAANLEPGNLYTRLGCLEESCRGVAYYLISLYEKTWIKLPGDCSRRFEQQIVAFSRVASGDEVGPIRFPKPVVDLFHESADALGILASISSFIAEVDPYVIDESYSPERAIEEGHVKGSTERVILWDRLEKELGRFDMEISLFATQRSAKNSSVADAMRRLLVRFRDDSMASTRKVGRLQPDVLRYLADASRLRKYSETGRKKVSAYFEEFSFREMKESLVRFDREQEALAKPDDRQT